MFQIEYRDADGLRRGTSCTPDELFEMLNTIWEHRLTLLEVWKVANGYMGRCYVSRKRDMVEIRDHYGDLIEARMC